MTRMVVAMSSAETLDAADTGRDGAGNVEEASACAAAAAGRGELLADTSGDPTADEDFDKGARCLTYLLGGTRNGLAMSPTSARYTCSGRNSVSSSGLRSSSE